MIALALTCLLGLQPIHICSETSAGSPCVVCVLGHSTAPAPSASFLPIAEAAEPVAVAATISLQPRQVFEQLFIRPPPSA